jgi:hypothetical protein
MKLASFALLAILAASVSVSCVSRENKSQENKDVRWIPFNGLSMSGGKVYYDIDSFKTVFSKEDHMTVNLVSLLIVPKEAVDIKNGGKIEKGRSLVEFLEISCESGFIKSYDTMVFDIEKPNVGTEAIGSIQSDFTNGFELDPRNPLYQLMCGKFI